FTDDREVRLGIDHQLDALTHHRMVIDDEDAMHFGGAALLAHATRSVFAGQRQRRRAPNPGRESIDRKPRAMSARKRIMRRPVPPATCSGSKPTPSSSTCSSRSGPVTRKVRRMSMTTAYRAAFSTASRAM